LGAGQRFGWVVDRCVPPQPQAVSRSRWSTQRSTTHPNLWPAPRPDPPWPCLLPAILRLGEDGGLAAPPFLTRGGQGVNGVVILVEALERLRIVGLNAGTIILGP